ncbi:sulfatase-like hydrolase/transferase [Persicitalea sp.]|uniref:sulfatase-like hydrolase/transferase n=1 Tax=Persicitalea sp. TaxID=3100273 RepID=UPI00359449CE
MNKPASNTRLAVQILVFLLVTLPISAQNKLPNIVIIYADDLGYGDLSSYGGDIPTPNIDRIGKEGIRFTDFYVSAPVCTPSRFSLLTGRYPQRSQHDLTKALMPLHENYLDSSETTLAEYLKTKGYVTALFGKWHLGAKNENDSPMQHGFDIFTGFKPGCIDYFTHVYGSLGPNWFVNGKPAEEKGYSTELITRHATEFLDEVKSNSTPFLLYLPYNAPHFGKTDPDDVRDHTVALSVTKYEGYPVMNSLQAPPAYMQKFAYIKDPYRRTYTAMVASLDDQVGVLLDKLEKDDLLENTIIWFISDNGGYSESYYGHASNGGLRGEKATLWEGGIRVPALMMWKSRVQPNQTVDSPICNVDLLPTLASIIGFKDQLRPTLVDGLDIGSVLFKGKKLSRSIFWQYGNQTALRHDDWKLVDGKELYNLREDRNETTDVAESHPKLVRQLRRESDRIAEKLGEP